VDRLPRLGRGHRRGDVEVEGPAEGLADALPGACGASVHDEVAPDHLQPAVAPLHAHVAGAVGVDERVGDREGLVGADPAGRRVRPQGRDGLAGELSVVARLMSGAGAGRGERRGRRGSGGGGAQGERRGGQGRGRATERGDRDPPGDPDGDRADGRGTFA
jgi:hypothetical protein